jgi:exopolysaccharide transport family protein
MEEEREKQIDLRDYLRVILKRRWTIITCFVIIVVAVAIATLTATPIYRATTKLIIEKENPNVVSIQEVMSVDASGTDYYQTQYNIIESRSIAREVIRRLNLDQSEEFFPKPKDDFFSNIKRSISETIVSWKEATLSLFEPGKELNPGDESDQVEPDSTLVSTFIEKINVEPIRNTRLVNVGFDAKDPVLAARIANTLAGAYIDQNLDTKLKAVQDAASWLDRRIQEERKKVEAAQLGFQQYKERYGIITGFSSDTEKITAQKLAELNTQVIGAEASRVEAETRYKQTKRLLASKGSLDSIPEILGNELIRTIKQSEVELSRTLSELSKKYGKNHPQIIAVKAELATLEKRKRGEIQKVVDSLKNEYEVALARERSLRDSLARQKHESLELNKKAIEFGVLRREAASAKQMYDLLVKRFKETSITEDMKTGNIRIVDRAEIPEIPIKPRKKLNILLAVIVGLTMGTGLAFFFEYLDNTVKTPDDIKRYFGMPYLGPVPVIEHDRGAKDGEVEELAAVETPKSTASEAYRGLRTSLLFSSAEGPPQVILITSAAPKEGKTLTCTNLAATMAQAGSKVLLVDCDMRRPRIHDIMKIGRDVGISNILAGTTGGNQVLFKTKVANLHVIPSGPIPPNPSELLGSNRMAELVKTFRERYDRIIIDSPPITAVTDATVLARIADGVVVIIRSGDTSMDIVRNGVEQLEGVNATILGAVLNGVNMRKDGYYYYQYYYYYYSEDGDKKKKARRKRRSSKSYT